MRKDPGPLFTNVASHCRRDLNRSNTELTFQSESLCLILTPTGTGSLHSACLLLLCYNFSLSFNCWPSIALTQLNTTNLLWNSSTEHRTITWLSVCLPFIHIPLVYFLITHQRAFIISGCNYSVCFCFLRLRYICSHIHDIKQSKWSKDFLFLFWLTFGLFLWFHTKHFKNPFLYLFWFPTNFELIIKFYWKLIQGVLLNNKKL